MDVAGSGEGKETAEPERATPGMPAPDGAAAATGDAQPPTEDTDAAAGTDTPPADGTDAASKHDRLWPDRDTRRPWSWLFLAVGALSAGVIAADIAAIWALAPEGLPRDLVQQLTGRLENEIALLSADLREARRTLGFAVPVAWASLVTAWVLHSIHEIHGARRVLAGIGSAFVSSWVLSLLLALPLITSVLSYVYGIVGGVAVVAWALTRSRTQTTWMIAVGAAIALWLAVSSAALGILFAENLPQKPLYFPLAVYALLGVSWAAIVLYRGAGAFHAAELRFSTRSEVTVMALLGALATGYGLWYGLIVEPTDEAASLDVNVRVTPMGGEQHAGRFAITITATNPADNPITIYASPYWLMSASPARALASPGPSPEPTTRAVVAAADGPVAEAAAADPTQVAVGTSEPGPLGPTTCQQLRQLQDPDRDKADILQECLGTTLPLGLGGAVAQAQGGGEGDQPAVVGTTDPCRGWAGRTRVGRCDEESSGQLWPDPVRLEPGQAHEAHLVYHAPSEHDILQVRGAFAFGHSQVLGSPERFDLDERLAFCQDAQAAGGTSAYRSVMADPISGLIDAWEGNRYQVGAGLTGAKTCTIRDTGVSSSDRSRLVESVTFLGHFVHEVD